MLDLNALLKKQKEGSQIIATLTPSETVILQNYGLLASRSVIQAGQKSGQPTTSIILNAFLSGICLGLALEIRQGQVLERSKS
jgi:hypothetical protein